MKKKHNIHIIRYVIYLLEILFFSAVSSAPNLIPDIMGRKPNLMVALLCGIVLFEGGQPSAVFGIICGFLIDINTGVFLGFHTSLLCFLSYFVGTFSKYYLQKNMISFFIVSTVFLALFSHVQFFVLYILQKYSHVYYAYLSRCIPATLYTWVFSQLFYILNSVFTFKLRDAKHFNCN
ncbi:MAG: rod shape-determining protein MreD [Oscillospiraceae bacterium]|jgi:rod shape-determining protein MreD|nr:rod shape-determining protein MreD [Oscillospiraceae bacterium]